jgi:hypothetical protein
MDHLIIPTFDEYITKYSKAEIEDVKNQVKDPKKSDIGNESKLEGILAGLFSANSQKNDIIEAYHSIKDNISMYLNIWTIDPEFKILSVLMNCMYTLDTQNNYFSKPLSCFSEDKEKDGKIEKDEKSEKGKEKINDKEEKEKKEREKKEKKEREKKEKKEREKKEREEIEDAKHKFVAQYNNLSTQVRLLSESAENIFIEFAKIIFIKAKLGFDLDEIESIVNKELSKNLDVLSSKIQFSDH